MSSKFRQTLFMMLLLLFVAMRCGICCERR